MKYLITGCSGFVGTHLVRWLRIAQPDATLVAVDRREAPADAPAPSSTAQIDLLDHAALAAVIEREQPDRLVHLASFSSVAFSWQHPLESFSNNTNVFLGVLEAVRRHSPKTRVLSIGSSEEYGLVTKADLPLTEASPLRPLSPYAVARVAQEHLGDVYVRGFGLDVVATRSFNHVGPGQTSQFVVSAIAKQFAELAKGKRERITVGTTAVIRDFLDIHDVVAAYVALLERGTTGEVYNICSGRGVSIADVIDMFAVITATKPVLETDHALVRPVENEVVIGSHAKITAAIGWRPTIALEDSLRAVYNDWLARI